jgi:hypothetical protein
MTIINIILEILAIGGMITAFSGSILMYFVLKFQKLGKILLIVGFIMMIGVIIFSLIFSSISG